MLEREDTGGYPGATALLQAPELGLDRHSHLLEVDFVHLELGLEDPRGQDAAAKQVLEQRGGR